MTALKKLWQQYQSVIAYLFFGGLTTVINIGVFFLLTIPLHVNYQVSNVIAWFLSVLVAYLTNKVWVFGSKYSTVGAFFREMGSFFFFRILTLAIDALILYVGISLLRGNVLIVKIIDQLVVVVVNYFFSKWFVFRNEKQMSDAATSLDHKD
ncbi:GtrA family protein [Furfurilactobacillus siliginis]|uniref:Membrane protein n=1 Tax=Furfurilactobacillus siliginis TaxID=348151 RepID=A0A0R2L811_9LACO|nr:GtrA family protein [Furfurilactobacillus siliginis]KRN95306.1 teichoic acid glycosylation protein [Furfurilactobacillus siliginis]GEK28296.1 membrane protein [Furfurilactobacillus siliginis]